MKSLDERTSARIARNAKPRERNIRDLLDERVAQYGGVTRAVSYLGRNGCPDVLCLFPDVLRLLPKGIAPAVWVETKRSNGRLSKAQVDEIMLLRQADQDVLVIHTAEELDKWLPPL